MSHRIFQNEKQKPPKITQSTFKLKQNGSLEIRFQKIIKEEPIFQQSNFYTSYLTVLIKPMSEVFDEQIEKLVQEFEKQLPYEHQKVSIYLQITQEKGIFYQVIKLWTAFMENEFAKIDQKHKNPEIRKKQIMTFFRRQYFLLCFFTYKLVIYVYGKPLLNCSEELSQHEIFSYIRDEITTCHEFSKIHNYIVKNIEIINEQFNKEQIHENMEDVEKVAMISKVPAVYMDSLALLKTFYKEKIIDTKVKTAVKLIKKIKEETMEYRQLNNLNPEFVIGADHIFPILTFLMWKLNKNISGACAYIELILSSQYTEINDDVIGEELDFIDPSARHSFETIKTISFIKRVNPDLLIDYL